MSKLIVYPLIAVMAAAGLSAQAAPYNRAAAYQEGAQKRNAFYNQARAAGLSDSRAKAYAVSAMRSKNPSALLEQVLKKAGIVAKPVEPARPQQPKPPVDVADNSGETRPGMTLPAGVGATDGYGVNAEPGIGTYDERRGEHYGVAVGRSDIAVQAPVWSHPVSSAVQTVEIPEHPFGSQSKRYLYNQHYSAVYGDFIDRKYDEQQNLIYGRSEVFYKGLATHQNHIPTAGKAVYQGKAIHPHAQDTVQGSLTYHVDFDKRTGSGRISGISATGDIALHEAPITVLKDNAAADFTGIAGKASAQNMGTGDYRLGFFGIAADEVAGVAKFTPQGLIEKDREGKFAVGFGGKRGEIVK